MNIEQIMSSPAVTCREADTLDTAARLMWEHDCGAVPVVDSDGGLVGMITDRDICMGAFTQGGSLQQISVSNAMAKRVFTCQADDDLDDAERLMSDKRIRRLPVIDDERRPIGMLSLNDIARYSASKRAGDGQYRALAETMAAICEPRVGVSGMMQHRAAG